MQTIVYLYLLCVIIQPSSTLKWVTGITLRFYSITCKIFSMQSIHIKLLKCSYSLTIVCISKCSFLLYSLWMKVKTLLNFAIHFDTHYLKYSQVCLMDTTLLCTLTDSRGSSSDFTHVKFTSVSTGTESCSAKAPYSCPGRRCASDKSYCERKSSVSSSASVRPYII